MSLKHEILRGTILLVLVVSAAGWFVVRRVKFARDPGAMASKLLITALMLALIAYSIWFLGPLGPFVIVACAIPLSLMWTPHLGAALAKPLTGLYDGGDEVAELRPFYSIAQAKQKRGLYAEAMGIMLQTTGDGLLNKGQVSIPMGEARKPCSGPRGSPGNTCQMMAR